MDTISAKSTSLGLNFRAVPKRRRVPFDQVPILKTLDAMEFIAAEHGRYLGDEGGYLFASIPKGKTDRALFQRAVVDSLPPVERNGEFSDLPIPADAGIAEMAHIVFFPNGIVGAEFNAHAPRGSRFGWYLAQKCKVNGLQINPLLSLDATASLDSSEGIKSFTIRTNRSEADIIEEHSQAFGRALKASAGVLLEAQDIQLVL